MFLCHLATARCSLDLNFRASNCYTDCCYLQVENAILIAWEPTSSQELKGQAFDFLTQLRNDASGWQICLDLFIRVPNPKEVVRLVSIEVVNNAIQNQGLDEQSLQFLKDNLLAYCRRVYSGQGQVDTPSIQNKLSQAVTSIFVQSYKQSWPSFIDDFLALTNGANNAAPDNLVGTALYLRVLDSVHDEIADVLTSRSGVEQKRNNELKDLLRDRDVQKVAKSWQNILQYWNGKNDNLVEKCLKVVGRWVNWVDISLIVNQEFLTILLQLIGRPSPHGGDDSTRDAAVGCLTETVAKKMKSSDKMDMIEFLNLGDIVAQLTASPCLAKKTSSSYDVDFADALAKLVNVAVFDIVRALEESPDGSAARIKADQQLLNFLPHLLRFFSDDYDEPCSSVIPSLTDLLTLFRKARPLPDQYSAMLPPILSAIITKMRYDNETSWDDQQTETDGAEFLELRKRLQVLQKIVAAVDQNLYIETLTNVIGSTFQSIEQHGNQVNWRDIDLALHEMYLFGELAIPNAGLYAKSQPNGVASERLVAMMTKMIESGKLNSSHSTKKHVTDQYRHCRIRSSCHSVTIHGNLRQILPVLREEPILNSPSVGALRRACTSQPHSCPHSLVVPLRSFCKATEVDLRKRCRDCYQLYWRSACNQGRSSEARRPR